MRKISAWILLLSALLVTNLYAKSSEVYFEFQIKSHEELAKLTNVISIDNVKELTVYAYASEKQLQVFEQLGYTYTILPHPGTLIIPEMSSTKDGLREWDTYPTYDTYTSMMYQFETDFPSLCRTIYIGSSVEGRQLLYCRISDNVDVEEDEPEVMFTSSMHGDETTGYVLMLRLIDHFLNNYGVDSLITRLVDSCEIWINPLANPDGTYNGGNDNIYGATRFNANGVDLNRNFPDPEDGPHPDGNGWQAENVAMMNFSEGHAFVISANFHGGIEVINYPWDTWSRLHVDNDWYIDVSREWADSAQYYSPPGYMTALNNGITNGYAWYTISGGRQDYMNYWRGCREVTAEISDTKLLPASQLPAHWDYNRASFLNWLEQGLYGIRGVVTDAESGLPLFAKIEVLSHDTDQDSSRVFTDPDVGDYHRMIEAGTYDVKFSSPGYYDKTVYGISVSQNTGTRVDVTLDPLPTYPLLSIASYSTGVIDPGDTANLKITLENSGAGDATNVSAVLSTDDTLTTVIQANSAYLDIPALVGIETCLVDYEFAVAPTCPPYHEIDFRLDITADDYDDSVFFSLTVAQVVENFESGDFTNLPWVMSEDQDWQIASSGQYEGVYSAQSGTITHDQKSRMSVTLNVLSDDSISFFYRVSSENNWDYLRFHMDYIERDRWSGEISWIEYKYPVSAGTHTFSWEYTKDGSLSHGSDCAWIDQIIFPPIAAAPVIITESLPDWTAGLTYNYQLEAVSGMGTLTWSDRNGDLNGTGLTLSSNGLLSGIPVDFGAPELIIFIAKVTDEGGASDETQFTFTINPAVTIVSDTLPAGVTNEPYMYQLQSSGGTGTISWSDKNGDLSGTGLSLSSAGLLSGSVAEPDTILFTARAADSIGAAGEKQMDVIIALSYVCGDANGNSEVDVADAVYIINYIFKDGQQPIPLEAADANCDSQVNVADAVYLINYIFKSGDSPCCP